MPPDPGSHGGPRHSSHSSPRLSHHGGSDARSPPHDRPHSSSYSSSPERHQLSLPSFSLDDDGGSGSRGMHDGSTSHASPDSSRALDGRFNKSIVEFCMLELEAGDGSSKGSVKGLRKCVARIRRELRTAARGEQSGKGRRRWKDNRRFEERAPSVSPWSCPLSPRASTPPSVPASSPTNSLFQPVNLSVNPLTCQPPGTSTTPHQAAFTTSRRNLAPSPTSSPANTSPTSTFLLPANLLPPNLPSPSPDSAIDSFSSSSAILSEASQPSSTASTHASLVLSSSADLTSSLPPTSYSPYTSTILAHPGPSVISESNNSRNSSAQFHAKLIPSVIVGSFLLIILAIVALLCRRRRTSNATISLRGSPSLDRPARPMSAGLLFGAGSSPQTNRHSSDQVGLALGGTDVDGPSRVARVRRSFLAVLGGGRGGGTSATSGSSFGGGRERTPSSGNASVSEESLDRGGGGYQSTYLYDRFGSPVGPSRGNYSPASGWTSTSSFQTPVLRTDGFPLPPSLECFGKGFGNSQNDIGSAQEVVEFGNGFETRGGGVEDAGGGGITRS